MMATLPAGSLKAKATRGAAVEVVSHGVAMVVRLGSNLVLTRLLFPEAFGLMALVNLLNQGLAMFSDVGLEAAVVQNKRGDDVRFLNTVWVIQITRGAGLYGAALLLAYPWALLYDEPDLFPLIALGSLGLLITGFRGTSMLSLRRHLGVVRANLVDLTSQIAGILVTCGAAYLWPSAWSLVSGMLVSAVLSVGMSHLVNVGYKNRWEIDPEARRALSDFGKWILAASALHFVSLQADRMLVGRLLGVAELGVYSIAVMMSEAVGSVLLRLTHGIAYPVLSQIHLRDESKLKDAYYRVRLRLDLLSMPALGGLAVLAPLVIDILYDDRYLGAGWVLSALCIRCALACIHTPCETCLFATGRTRYGLYRSIVRLAWLVVALPVGWHLAGLQGLVTAVVLAELVVLIVLWVAFQRAGLLRMTREALTLPLFAAGAGLGLLVRLAAKGLGL